MKKLLKILVAAIFLVALFLNVSINANKAAEDTSLFRISSNANAGCEGGQILNGKCDTTAPGGPTCKYQGPWGDPCDPYDSTM